MKELTCSLLREAREYGAKDRELWNMTAYEISNFTAAKRRRDERRNAERRRANEILAFNIGALVLAAVNAPSRFPKTPESAFGYKRKRDWREEKSDFFAIAKQMNERFEKGAETGSDS